MKKFPTISQYAQSVANPYGLTRRLGEIEAQRDMYGEVRVRAGNSAAVFLLDNFQGEIFREREDLESAQKDILENEGVEPFWEEAEEGLKERDKARESGQNIGLAADVEIEVERSGDVGSKKMLKCYIKPMPHQHAIYDYISRSNDPLFAPTQLLEQELFVYDDSGSGAFHDVVIGNWVEGITLEMAIKDAVRENDKPQLGALSGQFEELALQLLEREWAHGDLKPENIICTNKGLRLIDYDALYLPTLEGENSTEIGTPAYQHPNRTTEYYNKHIDDYSIALIAVSLRALSLNPELYERYNTTDNIILHPSEVLRGESPCYEELLRLFTTHGAHHHYRLTTLLSLPTPALEGLSKLLSNRSKIERSSEYLAITKATEKPQQTQKNEEPKSVDRYNIGNLTGQSVSKAKRELSTEEKSTLGKGEGYPRVFEEGRLWGYRDSQNRVVIEAIYDDAQQFSEGLAVVQVGEQLQVIEPTGGVVISDRELKVIKPFSEGLAVAQRKGEWGFLTKEGKFLPTPTPLLNLRSVREGVAAAQCAESQKWGYIEPQKGWRVTPRYDHAYSYRESKAKVVEGAELIYIDKWGNRID